MFQDVLVDTAACADSYKRSIVCKFQTRPYGACYFRWTPFPLIVGVTIGFRGAHMCQGVRMMPGILTVMTNWHAMDFRSAGDYTVTFLMFDDNVVNWHCTLFKLQYF